MLSGAPWVNYNLHQKLQYFFLLYSRFDFTPTSEEKEAVIQLMGDMLIKADSFVRTAPVYAPNSPRGMPTDPIINLQTVNLCEALSIDDPLQVLMARSGRTMKQPDSNTSDILAIPEPEVTPSPTPVKCSKMSLPAPVTPSDCDSEISHTNSLFSPETPSESNSVVECSTPVSVGKKTFKRRNQSLYTPDADDSQETSSSLLEEDSPRSSKLLFMENNSFNS